MGKTTGTKPKLAEALKGNQNRVLFKTPVERKAMFDELIRHLENGYGQDEFVPCDWDTVESYCKKYPDEFPAQKIQQAKRRGYRLFMSEGIKGMTGKTKYFNATAWIFMMKNKFKWRNSVEHKIDGNMKIYAGLPPSPFVNGEVKKARSLEEAGIANSVIGSVITSDQDDDNDDEDGDRDEVVRHTVRRMPRKPTRKMKAKVKSKR